MALRIYGHKLPSLPTKTTILIRGFSEEQTCSYTEDNEDEPLLTKTQSENASSKVSDILREALFVSSQGYQQLTPQVNSPKEVKDSSTMLGTSSDTTGVTAAAYLIPEVLSSSLLSSGKADLQSRNGLVSANDGAVLSGYDPCPDTEEERLEPETFELSMASRGPATCSIPRSRSSQESGHRSSGRQEVLDDWQHWKEGCYHIGRRALLPRSRSQPVAVREEEYSQYWRGQVTIVDLPWGEPAQTNTQADRLDEDDQMSSSAISTAILGGKSHLLLDCLRHGQDPHLSSLHTGRSFLHLVASWASPDQETRWVPMVYQLSNAGVDVNARDAEDVTPLSIAIKRRLVQIVAAMLKCGAELTTADQYQVEQMSGLVKSDMLEIIRRLTPSYWSVVDDCTHFKIKRLLKAWARVNISRGGETLIEHAKQKARDSAVVPLLLQHEASIELAHAVMAGDVDRTKLLLCHHEADLTTRDFSVRDRHTPLTLTEAAIKYGHLHVLEVLEQGVKARGITPERPGAYGLDRANYGMTCGSPVSSNKPDSRDPTRRHQGSNTSLASSEPVGSVMCAIV